ncbi:MAG: helix-turn-helix transcriptional regulator [Rhodospirillales bacterium]|nr:helix-turn-helix transcriptional regulator [Rhodospirillales bacterium]MCB9979565.1 helix-turn-helix transcriptional regulator [Rhodospirillales bacterium]
MITLIQIKAARALLSWTQENLAQAARLSLPAINNLERGLTTPRRETLISIENALTQAGIDFIDQRGVKLRPPELETQIIEGPDWLKKYDDIIISHMNGPDDEICQFSCDERLWMTYGGTTNHHYIVHRNRVHFKERILVPQNQSFVTNLQSVYRYHNDQLFKDVSWQVFGPYVSQIVWRRQQIILTRSVALAEAQLAIFNELWGSAKNFTDAQWNKLEKWKSPTTT